jgi:hypothetical protein
LFCVFFLFLSGLRMAFRRRSSNRSIGICQDRTTRYSRPVFFIVIIPAEVKTSSLTAGGLRVGGFLAGLGGFVLVVIVRVVIVRVVGTPAARGDRDARHLARISKWDKGGLGGGLERELRA